MLLKNIIITTVILVITSTPAISFQTSSTGVTDDEPGTSLAIQESNFSCFQNLQCLIDENPFKKSNLGDIKLNNNRAQNYVIEGSSKNEEIYAVYDAGGRLLKATALQRNIALPRTITEVLAADEFKAWRMIGNELVIQNFDKDSMQYKVILQNGDEVRVEYFDRKGGSMNRFS